MYNLELRNLSLMGGQINYFLSLIWFLFSFNLLTKGAKARVIYYVPYKHKNMLYAIHEWYILSFLNSLVPIGLIHDLPSFCTNGLNLKFETVFFFFRCSVHPWGLQRLCLQSKDIASGTIPVNKLWTGPAESAQTLRREWLGKTPSDTMHDIHVHVCISPMLPG